MKSNAKGFMVLLTLLLLPSLVWAGTWEKVVVSAPKLSGHTCVFDSASSNMYIFGDAKLTDENIYRVNLAVADKNMMVIASSDTVKRFGHSAVYDPNSNRIIVFGGNTGTNYNDKVSNTVYSFDTVTDTWAVLPATGTDIPVARSAHSAVYDPQFKRMIIYGGWNKDQIMLSDTYTLDLSTTPARWSKVSLAYEPSARRQATAVFDSARNRMVIFGGLKSNNEPTDEIWCLNLSVLDLTGLRWTQIFPVPTISEGLARTAHVLVYNPDTDQLLVYGGWAPLTLTEAFYDTTYAFDFNSLTWSLVAPGPDIPQARRNASGIYDPIRRKMVIFGGAFGSDIYAETFSDMYVLNEETNWAPAKGKGDVYNYPNPFNSSSAKTTIKFYCNNAQEVKIAVYSLIGELVKDWTVNGVKGINSLEWDGANGDGKKVESGGYICVIDKGGAKSKFKIGVIR